MICWYSLRHPTTSTRGAIESIGSQTHSLKRQQPRGPGLGRSSHRREILGRTRPETRYGADGVGEGERQRRVGGIRVHEDEIVRGGSRDGHHPLPDVAPDQGKAYAARWTGKIMIRDDG
jgi:hypothetical protein